MNNNKKIYVIDLFCGAGGTSTAIHKSNTNIEVMACVNHDKNAILSHKQNYPNCKHYVEDIRTLNLSDLVYLVYKKRKQEPGCSIALWASLECTNFSRAKCGPKDADSRTLAYDLFRYLAYIQPEYLWIENVQEFLQWGPLDNNGKIIQEEKGKYFKEWKSEIMKQFGFNAFWKDILCSADFGGYTIRKRLFIQFAQNENRIGIPKKTTADNWKPVKEILELDNHGKSIFTRKKPFVWKTHKRIYKGLVKFGKELFGYKYYGQGGFVDIGNPCCTLTTKDRVSLVKPVFIKQDFGKTTNRFLDKTFSTLAPVPKGDIISVNKIQFVSNPQYGGSNRSINKPACTIIARQDKAPLGLASATIGSFNFKTSPSDDEWLVKIKEYCKNNGISDILVRPLTIKEMLKVQGFPDDYVLIGTQTEQKKYIGNSVEVNVGIALFKAISEAV